jgi:hypothetical protein
MRPARAQFIWVAHKECAKALGIESTENNPLLLDNFRSVQPRELSRMHS